VKDVQGVLRRSRTATTRHLYAGDSRERPGNGKFHQHGIEKVALWDNAKARAYCYFSREAVTKPAVAEKVMQNLTPNDTKLERRESVSI
jgi:hypothetical protein